MVDGTPLSRKTLIAATGALVSQAGVDMSGHKGFSFRRGGATALQDARVEDRLIKLAGRWRSNAYARYIDTNLPTLLAHMQSL